MFLNKDNLHEILCSPEYAEYMKNEFYSLDIKNLPYEIWEPIPDTNDKYMVSNYGRIKSTYKYNASAQRYIFRDLIINRKVLPINTFIPITINKQTFIKRIDSLVCDTFIPIPYYLSNYGYTKEMLEIIHLDTLNMNNCAWNLRWVISQRYIELQDLPGELWKEIRFTDGQYYISNKGRVKSKYYIRNGRKIFKDYIISPTKITQGYYKISIKFINESTIKLVSIHRLVAEAFILNPNNYPCVNHKDEDKSNNCADNLEWCTEAYNNSYGTRLERVSQAQSKPITRFDLEGNFIANYPSASHAAKLLNYERRAIDRAVIGKSKISYGSIWKETKPEYKPGYKLPKDEIDVPLSSLSNQPKTLCIYDLKSNQLIKECKSLYEASEFLHLSRSQIRKRIKKHNGIYKQYKLEFVQKN